MKRTSGIRAWRTVMLLAAAAAFAGFGIGTAQAQQFTAAGISLDNAGNMACKFRETGLGGLSVITYDCSAQGVEVVSACFVKNKFVPDSFSSVILKNVTAEETEPLVAKNNGAINTSIVVEVPEGDEEASCSAGAEPHTVAVRWCNAQLKDVTNNVVGATASDLISVILRTDQQVAPVDNCATILAAP